MGDAASNQPVLAASDLGQSNLDGGGGGGAAAGGGGGGGGFIALDVSALSSLAGDGPDTTAAPPRTPKVVRSLSRKGERKPADGDGNGAAGTGKRPPLSPLFVHVAAADDMVGLGRLVHTPVAGTPGGKSRRLGRQPAAPWLDPRRVVFFFATLSSVGTLILLYFTLSMSKMGGDSGGGGSSDAR
uniref:Uncharacterized protein n=1 Tax=Oryza meridionalis TaxID=40149 RepID=A0A0E0ECD5_9ORYZ